MTTLRLGLLKGVLYDELYASLGEFTARTGIETEVVAHLPQHELNHLLVEEATAPALGLDVVTTHTKYAPSQRRLYRSLDDLLGPDELDAYLPEPLKACRIEGRLCQLPRNCDVRLYTYRQDLVGDLIPDGAAFTWEDALAVARRVARPASGLSGFVFTGKMSGLVGSFYELMTSAGGVFLGEDDEPLFLSSEGEWALQLLRDLYETADGTMTEWSYDEVANAFASGQVAAYTEWPGYWAEISRPSVSRVADVVGVALYPVGPSGRRCVYGGCHTFAITNNAPDVPAALELLRFLTSDAVLLGEAARGSLVPKRAVINTMREKAPAGSLERRRLDLLYQTMEEFLLWPPRTDNWPVIEESVWPILRDGYSGKMDVQTALSSAVSAINEGLVVNRNVR
jgi:multiple sugar transport system substrate-binding protein